MFTALLDWIKSVRAEDPRRMQQFRQQIRAVSWDKDVLIDSLSRLFEAVDDLAEAEIKYYYRRRGSRASISGGFRIAAWVFGSIGLLLPLLSGTSEATFKTWGQFGYVFLAAAASFLAANSLFGGTTGHVRFVSTQLELEKLVTSSRISWCAYVTHVRATGLTDKDVKDGFDQIQAYAQNLYSTTISETGHWGETLLTELMKYQKSIEEKNNGGGKAK